jgi:hypothetical protein
MKKLLFAAAFLLCASFASAQTPTVPTGATYQVQATHDGINTVGYRLYVDAVQVVDVPVSVLAAGKVTITAPALTTRGAHTVVMSAYNADNESKSVPFAFTGVLPAPGAPGNITIIINIQVP